MAEWLRERGVLVTELSAGRRSLEATFLKLTAEATENGAAPDRARAGRRRSSGGR
jgi:hypothetical protein